MSQSLVKDAVMFLSVTVAKEAITIEQAKNCLTAVIESAHVDAKDIDVSTAARIADELDAHNRTEFKRIYLHV